MSFQATQHKAFALSSGVPEAIYDDMNARWSAHNAKIRAARDAYYAATDPEQEEAAAVALEAAINADW